MTDPSNTTVGYSLLPTFICPSENVKARPASPWAPFNYAGNVGGPGTISSWSGIIVPGTNPWYNNSNNQGAVGTESITDGTSNTAMWSEHLIGINDPGTNHGNLVTRSDPRAVRAMFLVNITLTHDDAINGGTNALAFALQCIGNPRTDGVAGHAERRLPLEPRPGLRDPERRLQPRQCPEHPPVHLHQQRGPQLIGAAPCAAPRRRATTPAASTSASATAP